jgi:hypothetical protein
LMAAGAASQIAAPGAAGSNLLKGSRSLSSAREPATLFLLLVLRSHLF